MVEVIKRDGRRVAFDPEKIVNAIMKAMCDTNTCNAALAKKIASEISEIDKNLSVEEIQDIVESKLMSNDAQQTAKAYIIYRNERSKVRDKNSNIIKDVWNRLNAKNVQNSNANVDERSFSGREKEASADLQKSIALNYVMSDDIANAHKSGLLYEHDLEKWCIGEHNCLNIDFEHVFKNGFKTRNGDVRPPASFSTACQLVAVAIQCQSQVQFGGVGSVHIDTDLAPYVKMSFKKHYNDGLKYIQNLSANHVVFEDSDWHIDDKRLEEYAPKAYKYAIDMLEREGRQATEGLFHNLNTLESRAGSQVPFSSLNYGRDTTAEGRAVSRWMLEASLNGIGEHHLTSIFPISIFQYKPGTNANPEDPNYDLKKLALKSMSKRIYPNWCNGNWSQAHETDNDPDTFFSTMG